MGRRQRLQQAGHAEPDRKNHVVGLDRRGAIVLRQK
jgi:hypothetical protein